VLVVGHAPAQFSINRIGTIYFSFALLLDASNGAPVEAIMFESSPELPIKCASAADVCLSIYNPFAPHTDTHRKRECVYD
jgi:hypothetical protein